jgi:hypothetical protein
MNATAEPNALERVVRDLAASRGIIDLDELLERINTESDPRRPLKMKELIDWPRIGFGHHLDAVLHLTDEERGRLARAFMSRVMEPID